MSNGEFAAKRKKLASSGVALNQQIAELERWGRLEIRDRGARLAEQAISIWPGPVRSKVPQRASSARVDHHAVALTFRALMPGFRSCPRVKCPDRWSELGKRVPAW